MINFQAQMKKERNIQEAKTKKAVEVSAIVYGCILSPYEARSFFCSCEQTGLLKECFPLSNIQLSEF